MENIRFRALEVSIQRQRKSVLFPEGKASDFFGELTFNDSAMKEYLPAQTYQQVIRSIEKGEKIDRKIADKVAAGMKTWALSKGATNYTHWFFPLSGLTAEKTRFFPGTRGGRKKH